MDPGRRPRQDLGRAGSHDGHRAAEIIRRPRELYKRGEMELEPLDVNRLVRETLDLLLTELLSHRVTGVTDFLASPLFWRHRFSGVTDLVARPAR